MEQARQDFHHFAEGLATVADNLRELMRAEIDAGASGIFFSCMGATNADFTREEYARIGRPFDLMALEGCAKRLAQHRSRACRPQPGK